MTRPIIVVVASLFVGCGGSASTTDGFGGVGPGGTTVGAACTDDRQCASVCKSDICTIRCASDVDCPPTTACIAADGGTCALACRADPDCAVGFECADKDRKSGGGKALVCRKP